VFSSGGGRVPFISGDIDPGRPFLLVRVVGASRLV